MGFVLLCGSEVCCFEVKCFSVAPDGSTSAVGLAAAVLPCLNCRGLSKVTSAS